MNTLSVARTSCAVLDVRVRDIDLEAVCRAGDGQSVGALGIATEGIVRSMYERLLAGLRRAWPELSDRDRAFFELHALVDDDHAETLRAIAIYTPPWCWHQHVASDDNRVEYVTATNLPALEAMGQTVLREEEL